MKIVAAPTRDGHCVMFSARQGGWGGCRQRFARWPDRRGERHGYLVGGGGGLFGHSRYYLAVSGSTFVAPGPKLYVVYADGSRERIEVIWVGKPIGAGFYYHAIPKAHRAQARRATGLELISGSHIVARQVLPKPSAPLG